MSLAYHFGGKSSWLACMMDPFIGQIMIGLIYSFDKCSKTGGFCALLCRSYLDKIFRYHRDEMNNAT